MPMPAPTYQQISHLSDLTAEFITTQRQRFFPPAVPLRAMQRTAMDGFFAPQLLDSARLLVVRDTRVENPSFYPLLVEMGFSNLPDFSQMAAITFRDVVA